MSQSEPSNLRILIATDVHLGYLEKDPVRGSDSFVTFEEILRLARRENVDCLVLSGDLFHENKPSRATIYKTLTLLRKHCLGPPPLNNSSNSFEMLDSGNNFCHSEFNNINCEDPGLNVRLPVFAIHGNHDDPIGLFGLCSMDLLSAAGLVNYFGKTDSVESISVAPIILKKKNALVQLHLYGIGSVRDERMARMFHNGSVRFERKDAEPSPFRMCLLHQNRFKKSKNHKAFIDEKHLDNCGFDLVVWGHEHECLIEPELSYAGGFYSIQPGSSIVTSLTDGESKQKAVCIIEIGDEVCANDSQKRFLFKKLNLKTVRPYVFRDVALKDCNLRKDDISSKVYDLLFGSIKAMIEEAKEQTSDDFDQPSLPLIRLRVDLCGGFAQLTQNQHLLLASEFCDQVANSKDMVLYKNKKSLFDGGEFNVRKLGEFEEGDYEYDNFYDACIDMIEEDRQDDEQDVKIEKLVKEFVQQNETGLGMNVLSTKVLSMVLRDAIEKSEKDGLVDHVKFYLDYLTSKIVYPINLDELQTQVDKLKLSYESDYAGCVQNKRRPAANVNVKRGDSCKIRKG